MKQHPDNPSWEGRPAVTHPEGIRPLSRLPSRRLFLIGGFGAIIAGTLSAPAVCSFLLSAFRDSTTLPQKDPHLFLDIPYRMIAWSPDGTCISVCDNDGVRVLDSQSGQQRWTYSPAPPNPADRHSLSPLEAAWSSDGHHLSFVRSNRVYILDAQSGKPVWVDILPIAAESFDFQLAWSPDHTRFALADRYARDRVMLIWDLSTHQQVAAYPFPVENQSVPMQLTWSATGKYLAALYDSGVIQVWSLVGNLSTWYALSDAYQNSPISVRPWINWSPQGEILAGGCYLGGYTLWQASTGKILLQNTPVQSADPQEQPCGSASFWSGYRTASELPESADCAWSPDGTRLTRFILHTDQTANQCGRMLQVQIWSVRPQQLLLTCQGAPQLFRDVTWSPDGHYLAACMDTEAAQDSGIQVWDTRTGKVLASYRGLLSPSGLIWSPNSRFLAVYTATDEQCTITFPPTCSFTNYSYKIFRVERSPQ